MNNQPLISVYLPTYNRSNLLKRAIDSVLNQTYENIELIVVDDCSTDDTKDVLFVYAKKDARVRYFIQEKNSGACACRNKAILEAKGEFITGLDDDDYFLPNRLEDFLDLWEQKTRNETILFSTRKIITDNKIYNSGMPRILRKKGFLQKKDILIGNLIGSQFFVRTFQIQSINGFDEKLLLWQDYDVLFRLLEANKAYCIDNNSYVVDQTHDMQRISDTKKDKLNQTYLYMLEKHKIKSYFMKQVLKNNFFHYDDHLIEFVPLVFGLIYQPNTITFRYLKIKLKRLFGLL